MQDLLRRLRPWVGLAVLMGVVVLVVAACAPGAPSVSLAPGQTAAATAVPTPSPAAIALHPVTPSDPFSLLAWLFTPIFQALFIALVAVQQVTGSMLIAIVAVTILVKVLLIPIYRQQIVSTKRTQLLAPELKEIQRRYKGDRTKQQAAQAEFYKERGVNPAAGCLPLILQFMLLIPMYSVFSGGLQNFDPNHMLTAFGFQLIHLNCDPTPIIEAGGHVKPCIDSTVFSVDMSRSETFPVFGFGVSILAVISALLQLVQSRMTLPRRDPEAVDDQNTKVQRQTMVFLPFISILYGGILPAGLFVYWIASTIFSIVQQYLILGWGGMFPFLGWDPAFARDHSPRFPVAVPVADPTKRAPDSVLTDSTERAARAATTIRPRERGARQGRRGRRR